MAPESSTQAILCDGCVRPATPEHIRERLARLEWAARFRPIHIQVLLLISSPPLEADFYDVSAEDRAGRSLDVLFGALGIAASGREGQLAEFQRRGIFLACVCECPLVAAEVAGLIERLRPAIARRIRFSYKPKAIVLLSTEFASGNDQLAAGREVRILDAGSLLTLAARGDAEATAELRAVLTIALQV